MAWQSRSRSGRPAWPAAVVLSVSPAAAFPIGSPLEAALHFFTREGAGALLARLESVRPTPVSPAERARVLAALPGEGEVVALEADHRDRLAAARRVLALHGREAVYVVKVIEVPQAAVALHARTVVLISRPALGLLDAEELQALVAHEIGHEYFWREYHEARHARDRSRLRTLELLADGLAIVTLHRAGLDHAPLTSGLEKMIRYNHDRFGRASNHDDYPDVGERRSFARSLARWLAGAME